MSNLSNSIFISRYFSRQDSFQVSKYSGFSQKASQIGSKSESLHGKFKIQGTMKSTMKLQDFIEDLYWSAQTSKNISVTSEVTNSNNLLEVANDFWHVWFEHNLVGGTSTITSHISSKPSNESIFSISLSSSRSP